MTRLPARLIARASTIPARILLALVIGVFVLPSGVLLPQAVAAYDVCSDDNACIHEYMAEQARDLLSNLGLFSNSEIVRSFNYIRTGTTHEDEKDHIFSASWLAKSLVTITHFWDADGGPNDPVENLIGSFPNAWHKVKSYWSLALGAYAKGDKPLAYHWLGHVVHLMGDMTLPTHVHDDMHFPDDDAFEDWMSLPDLVNAGLSQAEKDTLLAKGPIQIPTSEPDKLYWLQYTTNQIADFFGSDDYDGDAVDPNGWAQAELDSMAATISSPRTSLQLLDNDVFFPEAPGVDFDNNNDGDLGRIRQYSYLRGIRSIAALYKLFEDTVGTQVSAVVVIDRVEQNGDAWHDWFCPIVCFETSDPDFWSRVAINGRVAQNRGDENVDQDVITPGWAYGHPVGTSGSIPITIEIWDHDGAGEDLITLGGADDQSDITPGGGLSLDLTVDLAKCLSGAAGAISGGITGKCGEPLTSTGNNDDEASKVTFRIFMSKSPPTADAGGPYTTPEGTDVTLTAAGSTDPDNDITSYAWDLDGDGTCDDATGATPTTTFSAVGQDGATTVKVCVTDATGQTDYDTATVTVNNVVPTISLGSDASVDENTTVTVSGTVTDPGWLDALSATISWGDGSAAQALGGTLENNRPNATLTFSASHIYGDNGSFTATVCAADDDSTQCQTIGLGVDNVAPTADIDLSGATSVNGTSTFIVHAGEPLDLEGRSTDPGSDDLTLAWNWGDGTVGPSTLYLVNPPNADLAPSPSIQPRDITESQTHAYIDACVYEMTFSSADDDGGSATDAANVIIVGNADVSQPHGFWKQEVRYQLTGKGPSRFDAAKLGCYLDIAGYMSRVFDERTAAATFAQAYDVLDVSKTSVMTELFDLQLLAVWLNFANGAIEFDQMVDTNGDKTLDTPFLAAVAAAETVRLNPAATRLQLEVQKNFLERLNNLP